MAEQSQALTAVAGARSQPASLASEDSYWKYFSLVLAIAFVLRLVCFTGLIGSDDLEYSRYAQLIAQFKYKPELSQFALRYGVIIPVGVAYKLFGIAEWTTVVVPLLASTASVAMLMLVGRRLFGSSAALLAGVLLATFPADLRYATILVPEPVAGAFLLAAVLVYLYWGAGNPVRAGFVSGLCIGVAYLTKEPALFVAPALMIDAAARRQWRIVSSIAVGLLLIVGLEHTYYLAVTGDLMFRPHAMVQHNESSYMFNVNQHLGWRLFRVYPKMMILPGTSFGLHSLFAITLTLLGFYLLSVGKWRLPVLWAMVPWIYLNFGTSSLTHYWVLPAGDRYLLPIYPPLFLLSAEVLVCLNSARPRTAPLLRIAFAAVVVSGLYCGFVNRGRGWHTDAVKKLRTIALEAKNRNLRTFAVKIGASDRWGPTLTILDHDLRQLNDSETADLFLQPDASGLPVVSAPRP
jgi:4-amino-4-deoxy-L-arabinose transferase-like glycosyltransferase